jgi:hypothetical protein
MSGSERYERCPLISFVLASSPTKRCSMHGRFLFNRTAPPCLFFIILSSLFLSFNISEQTTYDLDRSWGYPHRCTCYRTDVYTTILTDHGDIRTCSLCTCRGPT